jgi:hypothetical protein
VKYERPKAMRDDLGQTVIDQTTIRMSTAQSLAAERDTLLHEVLHSVWYVMRVECCTAEQEEEVVVRLATGLLAVLRDNPQLVTFLASP